jgi:antibiotic biosynthesis monooxygenase (ABM) superfamily enzyme
MINHIKSVWRTKRHQILIAWLAAWPTLTLVLFALQPFSHNWPLPLRSLVSATAMVLMMNFISVPSVSALVGRFLEPQSKP